MSSRERVIGALERRGYDRIPVFYQGTPEITQILCTHLGVADLDALRDALGQDLRYIAPSYVGPQLRTFPDGSREGLWGERYADMPYGDGLGTYPEAVHLPFAEVEDPAELDAFRFPSADWYDYQGIREACQRARDHAVVYGGPGHLDLINGIARCRGVEQVLIDVATEDPVYLRLVEERYRFFYEVTERVLQAAGGLVDIVHCGEDLGTQRGPLISLQSFDRTFARYYGAYFDLAHRYGARVMMHSCGSVRAFLPRLIDLGLDILDVVQVAAEGMALDALAADFPTLSFSGTMCVQTVLPHGTVEDVEREVERRLELFPDGGLILGPTHAVQVLTPVENILAMYRAAGSLSGP